MSLKRDIDVVTLLDCTRYPLVLLGAFPVWSDQLILQPIPSHKSHQILAFSKDPRQTRRISPTSARPTVSRWNGPSMVKVCLIRVCVCACACVCACVPIADVSCSQCHCTLLATQWKLWLTDRCKQKTLSQGWIISVSSVILLDQLQTLCSSSWLRLTLVPV